MVFGRAIGACVKGATRITAAPAAGKGTVLKAFDVFAIIVFPIIGLLLTARDEEVTELATTSELTMFDVTIEELTPENARLLWCAREGIFIICPNLFSLLYIKKMQSTVSNQSFTGLTGNIKSRDVDANTINTSTVTTAAITVSNSAVVGSTITAYLPASFFAAPFPVAGTPVIMVDFDGNPIKLPNATNVFFSKFMIRLNGFGPSTPGGGTWAPGAGTCNFTIGTSALTTPPVLAATISGAALAVGPFNAAIGLNPGMLQAGSQSNNYTLLGSVYLPTFYINQWTSVYPLTSAATESNYLCIAFGVSGAATLTPGTFNAVGTCKVYISYCVLV